MNQGEGNYYHLPDNNYDNGYTNEYGDFVQNYAPLGLEVPNTRLYSDVNCASITQIPSYYNEAYQADYPPQAVYPQQAKPKFSQYDNNQYVYPEEEPLPNNYYYENNTNNCKYCEYKKTYYPELYQRDLLRSQAAKESEYYAQESRKKLPKPSKKYPVTVKMSKYVKNTNPAKSSALCLPVVTQPLVRRKSKTNQQTKKNYHPQSDEFMENDPRTNNDNYSAHKMHSQGDVKNLDGIGNLLEKLKHPDESFEEEPQTITDKNKIKELAKILKPRVPSSIRFKQQQQTSESDPNNPSYGPRLKISMDKLLTRLQKCETSDEIVNGLSPRSSKTEILSPKTQKDASIKKSYNYEELSKKCQKKDEELAVRTVHKAAMNKSAESVENKKIIKSLDDNCALDLHRSKSYIVDLIDKALSKELGTVPRGQSIHHNLSPQQAITTIGRHRQNDPACYELTPKLANSFASAPVEGSSRVIFEKSASDGQIKPNTSGIDCYVKQLKHLRWGHIRHIQHEAKKLADLEEFLENCGEISD
ncbi:unnamed protein product [Ceutorhynchus assimilis]|uniref:Uncharacterized protein n=1 Tax=Ceutorhynchus assimilis TaxID=467358 RepID=A0A9P0GT36_9CUCU|nr:unnamed protein product [Ceutorhynchus assimilis]